MPIETHKQFSKDDINRIMKCRGEQNRLGFAYQLAFVRFRNRFPIQEPLEIEEKILSYASAHSKINTEHVELYGHRRKTVSEHQDAIRDYLRLRPFSTAVSEIKDFLFKEACQLEQTASLIARLKEFLRTQCILEPAQDTLIRIVRTQREAARTDIYDKVAGVLSNETRRTLDVLLSADDDTYSPLHYLKKPPGNPSPASFIKLTETLDQIKETGIPSVDMSWLNNNFQRSLARYARQCSTYRMRRLKEERRYTVGSFCTIPPKGKVRIG